MTNRSPVFNSSSATGGFTKLADTTDSTALQTLSGHVPDAFPDRDAFADRQRLQRLGPAPMEFQAMLTMTSTFSPKIRR
ncbi:MULTISPECIES: hypothetical protein [Bradyrhizobium]|uniref:hypothetical protein n=1 Tax=Bradyrhizobium TaxID=374 RepID=UPI001EDC0BF4|nr:hypothetical protein [Bradyrhizobium zhengyangense]MCG2643606.1 hypothetical protein [Bradyrhizobium zhengyangense]